MVASVAILGATGSIGQSTLKVLAQHPEHYRLYAVSGFQRMNELVDICIEFLPSVVAIPSSQLAIFKMIASQKNLKQLPQIVLDEQGLIEISAANEVDIVMAAIVGAAGLLPTLAAAKAGKRILLANKESLVMSGDLLISEARKSNALLLPVDSEHNAIFQCLPEQYLDSNDKNKTPKLGVSQILLTASGGPFLNFSVEQLSQVTPEQACKHPNWSMGRKISVDSATLMNKGLELIEACHLFSISEHFVTVVIHPQSIIHSMVQYIDGSTLAQMGNPDMCTPIAHALAWPQRISTSVKPLNLFELKQLDFYEPDVNRFPALNLARQAMRSGGVAPTILNAANEVAVEYFLHKRIGFIQISELVESILNEIDHVDAYDMEMIISTDHFSREAAIKWIKQYGERQ